MATATLKKPAAANGRQVLSVNQPLLKQVDIDRIDVVTEEDLRTDEATLEIEALAASIKQHGMLQPVLLRPLAKQRFQLVAGGRRLRAAQKAGWVTVPATVKPMNDAETALARLEENIQRKNLNPVEIGLALLRFNQPVAEGGLGMTEEQIGETLVGRGQASVNNHLRLLDLPECWQKRVAKGELTLTSVREIMAFRKQPNLMAAIDNDYRQQPELYATYRGFRRQVELIARHDPAVAENRRWKRLPEPEADESIDDRPAPQFERAMSPAKAAAAVKSTARAISRDERVPLPLAFTKELAESVIDQLDLLESIDELRSVIAAAEKRIAQIEKRRR